MYSTVASFSSFFTPRFRLRPDPPPFPPHPPPSCHSPVNFTNCSSRCFHEFCSGEALWFFSSIRMRGATARAGFHWTANKITSCWRPSRSLTATTCSSREPSAPVIPEITSSRCVCVCELLIGWRRFFSLLWFFCSLLFSSLHHMELQRSSFPTALTITG